MGHFPTTPAPVYFQPVYWMGVAGPFPTPCGIWYDGAAVSVRLAAASTATSYTVEWWNPSTGGFDVVSTGVLAGTETLFNVTAPGGGWKYGWYRLRGDGPTTDAVFGTTCFTSSFVQVPSSPHFQAIPNSSGQQLPDFANAPVLKGCMGVGTTRSQIDHASDPTSGQFTLALLVSQASLFANYWTQAPVVDPVRTRYLFTQFVNAGSPSTDTTPVNATSSTFYVWCYCKDGTLDGSLMTITVTASSGTACTITAIYNGGTPEVWNVTSAANAVAQINAGSNLIRVFVNPLFSPGSNPVNSSATAIGNTIFNNMVSCVSTLYPLGFTRYEIPRNEPNAGGTPNWSELSHQCLLGTAAIHAGNAAAKSMGPGLLDTGSIGSFLAVGGGANLDEITTHIYDVFFDGTLASQRAEIATFVKTLQTYGVDGLKRWITEGNDDYICASENSNLLYGLNSRRLARLVTIATLLWEEGGIPREQNPFWYDVAHGAWDIPSFLWTIYGGPMAHVPMLYTLANETWGQTYQAKCTLPAPADRFLLAQRYSNGSQSTMVLQLVCWMASSTVTLAVGGASSLTVVDGFGNTSTVAVSGGLATVSLSDTPTYVRLPTGVTANIVTVNGWSVTERVLLDSTRSSTISGVGSTLVPVDGGYQRSVSATGAGPWQNTLIWAVNKSVNRLIVFAATPDGAHGPPLTFTVEVSTNGGSSWTTNTTVDVSAVATTVLMGSDQTDTGTQLDTSWPQQCVFDVALAGGPLTINGIRVNCSAASYGASPNSTANTATGLGGSPTLTIKQLVVRG